MKEEEEYISRILLELQPKFDSAFDFSIVSFENEIRSRRGYRRLLGIRENKSFNQQLFHIEQFTTEFLQEYDQISLRKGQHVSHFPFFLTKKI